MPQTVDWHGEAVTTGIFKTPVDGPLEIVGGSLEGDGQADLVNHGGRDKAVYGYPSEHYGVWRQELGHDLYGWGSFGENLTTAGLDEAEVRIGDVFRVGTATLQVTQPRVPCFKLGLRFADAGMVKRFLHSGRSGFYFAVLAPGRIEAGNAIERVVRDPGGVTVADCNRLLVERDVGVAELVRILGVPALATAWRQDLQRRLERFRAPQS